MAIYRCEFQVIKRSEGRSACAAAAYRAGVTIDDAYNGKRHNYSNRSGVHKAIIMAPKDSPDWIEDRSRLWNEIEKIEGAHARRASAQLARECLLTLPHELSNDEREALVKDFVAKQFVSQGMVADIAIHLPGKLGDERNHHAHVMLTMRDITPEGFGKKNRTWNEKAFLEKIRKEWAIAQNEVFAKHANEELNNVVLTHKKIKDKLPQHKVGAAATAMQRRGEKTRVKPAPKSRLSKPRYNQGNPLWKKPETV